MGFREQPNQTYRNKLDPIINLQQFAPVIDTRKNAKNPVVKEEERIVKVLSNLKESGKISSTLYDELKPIGSQAPRLYGLAKVHKTDTPLRPIVSMPGSAYYKVAKKVADWLSMVPECRINTSTEKVSAKIKNISLSDEEQLISFDVTSLYTNVPVRESILHCADLLFKHVQMKSIDKETFITLAELACCNVVFATHRGYFTQQDGLAMGSPPAPHLANGWLSKFDNTIKGDSDLYERYMDDVLCSVRKSDVDERLSIINNLHDNLKFTYEIENECTIPFLDMLILNKNGSLSSSWYRKPTDTGLTLNFHALAPNKYKKSVVSSFLHRIYRASSTWETFHNGLSEALQILKNNQYPDSFVSPIVNTIMTKLACPHEYERLKAENETSVDDIPDCLFVLSEKEKYMFCVNYRGKPTEKLANSFKKLNAPCRVIMKTRKLKTALPSLKPTVPKMLRSSVVYKIDCPGCDASYIGETLRLLQQRLREHLGKSGTIRKHLETCQPTFQPTLQNFEKQVTILACSNSPPKLLTHEALFIKVFDPSLNTKDEFRSRTLTLKF